MAPTTALHGGRKFRAVEIMIANELFAGVEMGGTKCVCILGSGPDDIRAVERLPTRAYDETLRDIEGSRLIRTCGFANAI
jgi:hypothetical protein